MDMKKILESLAKFAGEPEQKPGDQVKGTDKAKAKKDSKHPFAGKLVGASESAEPKSMLADLSQAIDKNSLEWQLSEEFSQFREEEESDTNHIYLHSLKGSNEPEKVATVKGKVTSATLNQLAKKYNCSTEDFEWGNDAWAEQFNEEICPVTGDVLPSKHKDPSPVTKQDDKENFGTQEKRKGRKTRERNKDEGVLETVAEGIEDADVSSIIVDEITKLIGDGHTEVAPDVIIAKVSAATGAPFMLKDLVAANNASPELQHYIDSINPSKVKFSTDILTVKNEDPMKEKEQAQAGVANMAARAANRDRSLAESIEDPRWEKLRDAYKVIQTIDPSSPTYLKLIKFLDGLSTEDLQSLVDANIKFVSGLARNRVNRRAQELNELSPQTLQNYIDRAEPQGKEHNARSMMGMQNAQDFEQKMADRAIAKKRLRGTSLAKKKLSSVEEGQEINKKEWKRTERGLDHSTYTHLPSGAQVYSIKRIESYTRAGRTRDRADSRTYTDWGWKLPNGRSDWGAGSMRAAMYIVNQWWEQQQSVTEGWGAESQKRAHEESQAAWNSLFAKYENDPAMTAKLQKLHRNNWKASYAELEAKKTANESRGHKIVQRKLDQISARQKGRMSDEELANFRAIQQAQNQEYIDNNPNSIYKKSVKEAGANNPPQANSTAQIDPQQVKNAAAATTALKSATGMTAPAPMIGQALDAASQGTAIDATKSKVLEPLMKDVATVAQDPKLANQFKSLAQQVNKTQQAQQQQQALKTAQQK